MPSERELNERRVDAASCPVRHTDVKKILAGQTEVEPFAYYDELRASGDIFWDEALSGWVILSMELGRQVYMNDEVFAHPYTSMRASELTKKIRNDNPRPTQLLKGEQQRAVHRWLLMDLLGPKWIRNHRPEVIDPSIDRIVASLAGRSLVDLVDDFCERIPVSIFCNLMGLSHLNEAEVAHVKQLNEHQARFTGAQNTMRYETDTPDAAAIALYDAAFNASRELDAYLRPVIRDRRENRGEDFISRLWDGGPAVFPDWNEEDMLDMCKRILFAGSDTTTHSIANALQALLTDAELMATVRAGGPKTMERLVEEMLRLQGTVQYRPRRATVDTELGGVSVKSGDMVYVLLLAANRDPSHFGCPHAIDLERPGATSHLTFIVGPRSCPGQQLARAEIASAVTKLLEAFPRLSLDTTMPGPKFVGGVFKSYRPLWARLS